MEPSARAVSRIDWALVELVGVGQHEGILPQQGGSLGDNAPAFANSRTRRGT
ncbi:MAG: hypothetical protein J0H97_24375 [Alphaproteobacteria bacterium]|jgi:hypothetical protein|nr:hypothetical protein [Alphaproteobacteria bacterium]